MLRATTSFAIIGMLAACAPGAMEDTAPAAPQSHVQKPPGGTESNPPPTRILDSAMAAELRGSTGITLQWISWDWRGQVHVRQPGETLFIEARQDSDDAPDGVRDLGEGYVEMKGHVTEIDTDYFIFDGTATIGDAPDEGRLCVREGPMIFRITQSRRYWRLQDMEGCGDGLTDYIDIYF